MYGRPQRRVVLLAVPTNRPTREATFVPDEQLSAHVRRDAVQGHQAGLAGDDVLRSAGADRGPDEAGL
jgi:hypothetical protein